MTWVYLTAGLIFSFLFSGLESSVLAVSRVRLRHYAKGNDRAAIRLEKLMRRRERLLSSILLLNNSLNFVLFAFIALKLVNRFGPWGYAIAIAVALPIYLLFLELIPKSLFKRFPFRILLSFLPLLQLVDFFVGPFVELGRVILGLFKKSTPDELSRREEFRLLAGIVEREGSLTSGERRMIEGVLDFQRLTAEEVMVPLAGVTAIPLEMPVTSALELSRETGYNQFPVISPEGEFVGIFNAFEVLRHSSREGPVLRHLHRLVRTHPREKAEIIMQRLRRSGMQLAAVYSSRGRPLGIVRSQDLLSRLLPRA